MESVIEPELPNLFVTEFSVTEQVIQLLGKTE
jgi:hypothetical protein